MREGGGGEGARETEGPLTSVGQEWVSGFLGFDPYLP